jgi:hypothetical protein
MRSLFLVALGFGAMTARSDRQDPPAPATPTADQAIAPDTGSVMDALFAPALEAAPRRASRPLRLDRFAPHPRR